MNLLTAQERLEDAQLEWRQHQLDMRQLLFGWRWSFAPIGQAADAMRWEWPL